ncbi:MAG: TonB-dependent receptor [Verrucomicrobiota bacterium]
MNKPTRGRTSGCIALACVLTAPFHLNSAQAQTTPDSVILDEVVVSATRTPNELRTTGSSVEKISGDDVARRQLPSLASALNGVAGAPVTTGGTGGATSIFLRGSNSNQTLVLVDGVRLGDSNALYANYIGGAAPSWFDTIEVVKGPQSTLYGADAVGGAVSINAQRGQGAPTASISAEAGSFGTYGSRLAAQGERGPWAYSAFVAGQHTDNDRANNSSDNSTLVVRVDRTLTDTVSVGSTIRGYHGRVESPDSTAVNDPNNYDTEQNWLATTFVEFNPTEDLTAKLTVGGQLRRVVSKTPAPNPGFAFPGTLDNERGLIEGQATYSGLERNRITAGFNAEHSVGENGASERSQSQWGTFLQDEINPVENVYLTAGLRYDNFNRYDDKVTGRGSIAWLVIPDRLKLRASYGTAYRTPAFTDLYGFFGNPNIMPETAKGGDAGVDFYLPDNRGVLSVTYFKTDYTDLITYPAPVFTPQNVGKARTAGVELASTLYFGSVGTKAAYTYLDAKNQSTGARLLRRPRHAVDLDVWNDFGSGITAGLGVHAVADSTDIDAVTFATIDGEDYTTVRVYAAWEFNDRLTLKARVENLFDEDYAAVNGFPSLGIGAFVGAEYRF